MSEKFAEVNGINICYEILGEGYPLILIHGYGGTKETWFVMKKSLSKHFKLILFDNRTAGKSDHLNEPITMQMFADDVKGLMDYLNIRKAHIGGESLGGMIAQQFVLSYPGRVNKLILINTHYSGVMGEIIKRTVIQNFESGKLNPEEAFWERAKFGFHIDFRKQLQANPRKKFLDTFTVQDLIRMDLENPLTINDLENQAYDLKSFNTLDRITEIKNPTLLIAASHDRILPNSQMKEMHEKISNSTLKILHKAGHFSTTSRAPEIVKLILDFLRN
ncbi:MAG: alpha/beta fold hydrolase [Candidatus Hodarchaeota archaeon]